MQNTVGILPNAKRELVSQSHSGRMDGRLDRASSRSRFRYRAGAWLHSTPHRQRWIRSPCCSARSTESWVRENRLQGLRLPIVREQIGGDFKIFLAQAHFTDHRMGRLSRRKHASLEHAAGGRRPRISPETGQGDRNDLFPLHHPRQWLQNGSVAVFQ